MASLLCRRKLFRPALLVMTQWSTRPPRWNSGHGVSIEEMSGEVAGPRNADSQPYVEEPGDNGEFSPTTPRRGNLQAYYKTGPGPKHSDFLPPVSMFGGFGSFGDLSFPQFGGMRSSVDHSDFFRRAASAPDSNGNNFSYSCSSWTSVSGGSGGPRMEHSISAHGNSLDGHHLKEMVRDGNSGQTRVLREESRPVGYRHGARARQAIAYE